MKIYRVLNIFLLIITITVVILYFTQKNSKKQKSSTIHIPRITQIGPYGKDIEITEKIDDLIVKFKAKRLFFKKSSIFIFKSTLYKKLVAQDIKLIVQKNGKKLLVLKKKQQVLNPDLNRICINYPQIIYPSNFAPPEKVIIDRNRSKILFIYKTKSVNFCNLFK